jgi:hypothetical protein
MEADFSGYATKAGLKCSDGRTIMADAFKHQDQSQVPLVWQHGHTDPENVLGHAILENRSDGVYAYGFFNKSPKAIHTHGLIEHKDITMMSIWANDLIERSGRVLHGAIREVSLVLSGANPGALIENVTIRHSADDDEITLDDEAIIYTGLELEHSSGQDDSGGKMPKPDDEVTIEDIIKTMTDKQQEVLHSMVNEALESSKKKTEDDVAHQDNVPDEETVQDVYDSMSEKQKQVLHFMVGEALASAGSSDMQQDNLEDDTNDELKKGNEMKHNVFEGDKDEKTPVLSHSDVKGIIADATRSGSLKDAVENYALAHSITNIDMLFPDAVALDKTPEFLQRRIEWVSTFLGGVRKSPFSRIKTLQADITLDDARAKGYVKGTLKKEEFFGVSKRVTTPTTIYKKQSLDRDDVVDITDFDVVAWLKAEMRLMLDEEIARAALVGDGRDVADGDKINEGNIRPIAKDHELYTTTLYVNLADTNSSVQEVIDSIVTNRKFYKGTGQPTMYTTESLISKFLLLRDTTGRRIYKSLDEVASELRVSSIVPVEVLEDYTDTVAIIVNPIDYVMGATAGGQVSMFDDFDIDYNKQKYLIETRLCGALVRLKSALVIKTVPGAAVLAVPAAPTFVEATGVVTIPTVTGVTYKNADTQATLTAGAQTALGVGATLNVVAVPTSASYYFATSDDDSWSFTR